MRFFEDFAKVNDVILYKNTETENCGPPVSIPLTANFSDLIHQLHDHHVGAILVVNEHAAPLGIISERDVIHALALYEQDVWDHPISEMISGNLISCSPDDKLKEVASRMAHAGIRHILVEKENNYIGLISSSDIELFAGDG